MHGQRISQEQFSKYSPEGFQAIEPPLRRDIELTPGIEARSRSCA
jgi:hypothetical protein